MLINSTFESLRYSNVARGSYIGLNYRVMYKWCKRHFDLMQMCSRKNTLHMNEVLQQANTETYRKKLCGVDTNFRVQEVPAKWSGTPLPPWQVIGGEYPKNKGKTFHLPLFSAACSFLSQYAGQFLWFVHRLVFPLAKELPNWSVYCLKATVFLNKKWVCQ